MHFNSFDEYLSAVTQVHEGNVRELGRVDETQPTAAEAEEPTEEPAEEPTEEPEEPKKAAKKAPAKKGAKK